MHRRTPTVDLLAPFNVLRRGSAPAPAPEPALSAFDPAFSPVASASSSAAPIPSPASTSGATSASASVLSRASSRRASAPRLMFVPTEPVPAVHSHQRRASQLADAFATTSASPDRATAPVAVPRASTARSPSATRSRPATVYAVPVKRKPVPKIEDLEVEATFHQARRVSVSERSAPSLSRQSSSTGLSSSLPNDAHPPPPPMPVFPFPPAAVGEGWAGGFRTAHEPAGVRSDESDGDSMLTCPEDDWVDDGHGGVVRRARSKAGSVKSRRSSGHGQHAVHRQGRRTSVVVRSLPPSPSLISVSFGKTNLNGHSHGTPPPRPARKGPRFEGRKGSIGSPPVVEVAVAETQGRRPSATSKHSRFSSSGSAAEWCDALEQMAAVTTRRPSNGAPFPQSVSDEPYSLAEGMLRSPSPVHEEAHEMLDSLPSDVFSSPSEFMTPASLPSPQSSYPLLHASGGLAQARPRPMRRPSVASSLASVGEGAESVEEDLLDAWMELMGPSSAAELDSSARRHGRRGSERLKSISEDSGVPLSAAFPAAPVGSSIGSRHRRGSVFPSGGPSGSSIGDSGELGAHAFPGADELPFQGRRERRLSSAASTFSRASSSDMPVSAKAPAAGFFGGFSWSAPPNAQGQGLGLAHKRAGGLAGHRDEATPSSMALSSAWSDSRSHPASDASASVSSSHAVEPLRIRKTASGGVGPVVEGEMGPPVVGGKRGSGAGLMPAFLRRKSEQVGRRVGAVVEEATGAGVGVQPLRTARSASAQGLVSALPPFSRSGASYDSASSASTAPAPTPRGRDPRVASANSGARPVSTFYSPFDSRSESLPPLFSHSKGRPGSRQSGGTAEGGESRGPSRQGAAPLGVGAGRGVSGEEGEAVAPYEGASAEWLANEKRRRSSAGLVTRSGPIKVGRMQGMGSGVGACVV